MIFFANSFVGDGKMRIRYPLLISFILMFDEMFIPHSGNDSGFVIAFIVEIINKRYVKLIIAILLIPVFVIGFTFLFEIIYNLGKMLGTYLSNI